MVWFVLSSDVMIWGRESPSKLGRKASRGTWVCVEDRDWDWDWDFCGLNRIVKAMETFVSFLFVVLEDRCCVGWGEFAIVGGLAVVV